MLQYPRASPLEFLPFFGDVLVIRHAVSSTKPLQHRSVLLLGLGLSLCQ